MAMDQQTDSSFLDVKRVMPSGQGTYPNRRMEVKPDIS